MKVSWTVMAERADPYARANPFVVEPEKPEHERGYYHRPELFGFGKDKGMDAARAAWVERLKSDPEFIAEQERRRAEMKRRWPEEVRRQYTVDGASEADDAAPAGE
jgi:hypothetical protein